MPSFKFSLISDMHVDQPQPKTPYDRLEEVVIVAGDTSNGLRGTKFLNKLRDKGFDVFAVDGNHEHYANLSQGRTRLETDAQFYHLTNNSDRVRYVDDLMIVGCNGWYPVTDAQLWDSYMNDCHYTTINPAEMNRLAVEHARFVALNLVAHDGPAIVVTHTAPCEDTLNPAYAGHYSNEWYWNPHMSEILRRFSDQILVWCHGHTHKAADMIVSGVRVVCNPRGYPRENPDWAPQTIEVNW